MPRIYLDSNIYRYLKKDPEARLLDLQKYIKENDQIHVFFSSAHLFDLGRDKTDHKFDDLHFMEQFTGHNYIHLDRNDEFVLTTVATPSEAFNRIIPDPFLSPEFQETLDILNGNIEDPELKSIMQKTMNLPLDLSFLMSQDPETKESLNNFFPDLKECSTIGDFTAGMLKKFQGFHSDPKLWRKAIKSSQDSLKLKQNYNIDLNTINFNQELKNTPLATTFVDFVKTIEGFQNPKGNQKEHNFHITAYNALNILGLDSERKINFASSLDDAEHSFYAAHCDYFIVEDKQLRMKSKVLYNLLGIDTKVLSLKEFKEELPLLRFNSKKLTVKEFYDSLIFELRNALILNTSSSFVYPRDYVKFKPATTFFQYFNRMDKVDDDKDGTFIVMYREKNNYSRFTSYREFEYLTNLLVEVFGIDKNFRGEFSETDRTEIEKAKWQGRVWTHDNTALILEINEGTKKLSLLIFP